MASSGMLRRVTLVKATRRKFPEDDILLKLLFRDSAWEVSSNVSGYV
jgi:hypothetical protein